MSYHSWSNDRDQSPHGHTNIGGKLHGDPISAWINNRSKEKVEPPFEGRLVGVAMTVLDFITLMKLIG